MTMRALVSAARPVVRIWHPDNPKVYVEIQFESQDGGRAVEWDVEVRDRAGVPRRHPVLAQANSEFPGVRPRLAELGTMS
jgi:hypothetical protein